jgi:heme/copper-type cytochrome/quinol oxidase subunit 3
MLIKLIIVIFLILIVSSLFTALFSLGKNKGSGTKTAKALTIRIGLSFLLFILLLIGYQFGIIGRH